MMLAAEMACEQAERKQKGLGQATLVAEAEAGSY